jgi:hypothetical protein
MELPNPSGLHHVSEPVVVHSQKWRRATASNSTFVWFLQDNVSCRVGNAYSTRSVVSFASIKAILSVTLPGKPADLRVLVDLWKVDCKTFGTNKANDIEAPQFAAFVPLKKKGGTSLVPANVIGGRVVFLRNATNEKLGCAVVDWNCPPLRNPPVPRS